MTVLTTLALAVVAFFAYQASAAPDRPAAGQPAADPTPAEDTAELDGTAPPAEETDEDGFPLLPADSGAGTRVVYALGEQRIWLVQESSDGLGEEVLHSYPVHRSSVDPDPGSYTVSSRSAQLTGSDGVPIEHVVVFTAPGDVVFGFSTATDGSLPDPTAEQRTGGIRQGAADGETMWQFAAIGTVVVVVP